MPNTEKAGTSLPQNCPELEPFIKAQAHIRAAVRLIDEISTSPNPKLDRRQKEGFRNLAQEIRDTLWECDSNMQDLLYTQFALEFPIEQQ